MRLELSRRGDYAVRAMIVLADEDGTAMTATQIAGRTKVPRSYLAQVMADLSRGGLVEPRIGRLGGYRLSKPAEEISLLAVIEAIEGDTRRTTCVMRNAPCSIDGRCTAHAAFFDAQDAWRAALQRSSLASAVGRVSARTGSASAVAALHRTTVLV